jgi:hypothetical protein
MEMLNLAHRARCAGIVFAAAAAATFGLVVPAAAEPAGPPSAATVSCSGALDGAVVCLAFTPGETPEESTVTATVRIEDGRLLKGALAVVEACSSDCQPVGVATGQDVKEVSTTVPYGRGVGTYRANGSWVDDQQHLHTGVTADW